MRRNLEKCSPRTEKRSCYQVTFEEYCATAFENLNVPPPISGYSIDSELDSVGIDSILAFELILLSEQLADVLFPPDDVPMIATLGDAYSYYVDSCQSQVH